MKIFLAYASPDKATAESVAFSLRGRGHKVFLDRDDLPPGGSFDQQIERAIKGCDIFVFLISPDSVAEGRYTLAELAFARKKWLHPDGCVLPIMTRKTPLEQVPPYLKAVTILEPAGNIAAETGAAVDAMFDRSDRRTTAGTRAAVDKMRKSWKRLVALLAACAVAGLLAYFLFSPRPIPCSEERNMRSPTSDIETTIVFVNKGKETIRLYWLDSSGKRVFYPPSLGPNDVASQTTYVNHAWIVADNKEACKAIYVATRQKLEVDVSD
jgi:TIR domain/VHL beta domain